MARNNVLITNQILTGSGADAVPSVAFGDADTGFLEKTDDRLTVNLGGTERFHFSGSEFTKSDGTPFITTATVAANAVGNSELSGQILWSKLADSVQGRVLYVNSQSQVSGLAVGTAGQVLSTNGAGADPSWIAAGGLASTDLQRRYIFSGQAAGSASTFMGVFQVPAGALGARQGITLRGAARGLSAADSVVRVSISGLVRVTAALTLNSTNQETLYCIASASNPNNTTECNVRLGQLFTTNVATAAGTQATDWVAGTFWVSGQVTGGTDSARAWLELWY